ncbi:MAG TPA: GNAT family N-acetyltransferase [Acidobacteriaceae bacterium]|nr:GNAT family N-acetyltransferase [Acidobacteriaceae bacterium]
MSSLIRSYRAGDEVAFRALNEQWIRQYFELEAKDEEVFADPQKTIVERGGHILFAVVGGETVGCCALLPMKDGGFEVAKMAVAPGHQGEGIGRQLLCATIEEARRMGTHRLYLETNHRLTPAIGLYESVGFRRVDPNEVSPYARSDVYMELKIESHP